MPADTFVRSQPVARAAMKVAPDKIASVPVATVAAPPAADPVDPRADGGAGEQHRSTAAQRPNAPAAPTTPDQVAPSARTSFAGLQAIQPERQQAQKAPGPEVVSRSAVTANTDAKASTDVKASTDAKAALPKLEPRNAAPPLPQIQGERRPATMQGGPQQATAPANQPVMAPKPGEPLKPGEPQANVPANRSGEPNRAQPGQPNQANLLVGPRPHEQRPYAVPGPAAAGEHAAQRRDSRTRRRPGPVQRRPAQAATGPDGAAAGQARRAAEASGRPAAGRPSAAEG